MSTDLEQELERITKLKGFRFGLHDFMANVGGAEALKADNDKSEANYKKESLLLDRKTRELLIVVACVAQKDMVSHIRVHMQAAHKAGASPEEILGVLDMVGRFIGGVAKMVGIEAWRATFRPDIPPIDRVVELR